MKSIQTNNELENAQLHTAIDDLELKLRYTITDFEHQLLNPNSHIRNLTEQLDTETLRSHTLENSNHQLDERLQEHKIKYDQALK